MFRLRSDVVLLFFVVFLSASMEQRSTSSIARPSPTNQTSSDPSSCSHQLRMVLFLKESPKRIPSDGQVQLRNSKSSFGRDNDRESACRLRGFFFLLPFYLLPLPIHSYLLHLRLRTFPVSYSSPTLPTSSHAASPSSKPLESTTSPRSEPTPSLSSNLSSLAGFILLPSGSSKRGWTASRRSESIRRARS